ncbi:DUF1152 domain-containing protein [Streptomyces sp. NBC_01808]|uniref:DUF1152 domain-containing protein n=1 Tax=Streptomyces sp. NBC_01808 TaxID=2975947 RepID=UPI002DDA7CB6|nr:DUF1152 domain-containing protein [Streptomyces sp. NBC_01808]WSA42066.1 DUF1152 domain-containing protein [Streptomyces sp. NBC_01808]
MRLLVAGPGLAGELPAETLHDRLGTLVAALSPSHVAGIAHVLRWHASEASVLLAATLHGTRGLCEIRDAGRTTAPRSASQISSPPSKPTRSPTPCSTPSASTQRNRSAGTSAGSRPRCAAWTSRRRRAGPTS